MKDLIKKYGGKIVKYKELPREHQLALAFFHSVDTDTWEFVNDKWATHPYFFKANPTSKDRENYDNYIYRAMVRGLKSHYVRWNGEYEIGTVEIPTSVIAQKIVDSGYPNARVKTVENYKIWIEKNVTIPNHSLKNRWPIILDKMDGILNDGYHRFSKYLLRGDETTPCLYYK